MCTSEHTWMGNLSHPCFFIGRGFNWMTDGVWDGPDVDFLCAVGAEDTKLCFTGGATGKLGLTRLVSWSAVSGKPMKGCICCFREWGIGLIVAGFNLALKDGNEEGPSIRFFLSSKTPFLPNRFGFDSEVALVLSLVSEADHLGRWKYGPFSLTKSLRWLVQKKRRRSASRLSNEATGVPVIEPIPSATKLLYDISGARCFRT